MRRMLYKGSLGVRKAPTDHAYEFLSTCEPAQISEHDAGGDFYPLEKLVDLRRHRDSNPALRAHMDVLYRLIIAEVIGMFRVKHNSHTSCIKFRNGI